MLLVHKGCKMMVVNMKFTIVICFCPGKTQLVCRYLFFFK